MNKYILIFTGLYTLALIASALLSQIFDLSGSMTAGSLIGSAMATSVFFVRDHKRAPTADERRQLARKSLLAAILLSAAVFLIVVLVAGLVPAIVEFFNTVPPSWVAIAFGIVTIVYYGLLNLCYGWITQKILVNINMK